jgi:signal transduction histidine kinase
LLVLALVLPCLALIALGGRMIAEGEELAEARQVEADRRQREQIGDELLARLERIKLEEAGRQAASTLAGAIAPPARAEVALVAWIHDGRIVLPWEVDPARARFGAMLAGTRFAEVLAQGERQEARGQYPQADAAYEQAIALAHDSTARDYAKVLRARTLVKCRCPDDARPIYTTLLESPALDDQGVPLALYAAQQLQALGGSDGRILAGLAAAPVTSWTSPAAAYLMVDVLSALAKDSRDADARRGAEAALATLAGPVAEIERALVLQRDWAAVSTALASRNGDPVWLPYDDGDWLVSTAPALAGLPPLAIAVRAAPLFAGFTAGPADGRTVAFSLTDAAAAPIGSAFPGLRVSIAGAPGHEIANWTAQRTFSIVALLAVIGMALAGGAVFWWDVRRELRTADLRTQFVASVSHELRTPLTAIRMFAETLLMERPLGPAERSEYLQTIVSESERLTRLVNNVLDYSRIERGEKVYHLEPASLPAIARDAARAMRYPLARQGFELAVEVEEDLPPVRVDRDAIEQAVLNLLGNAVKYSGDARAIDLRVARVNGDAVIAVRDRGVGIADADRSRIFERFYRAPTPENARIPGTGLGLALVDHIVKAHQGRVDVVSAPGAGSTFAIHLPHAAAAAPDVSHAHQAAR